MFFGEHILILMRDGTELLSCDPYVLLAYE